MNPSNLAVYDSYSTPSSAWEALLPFLDKTKVYYDPFFNEGLSCEILSGLGLQIIHEDLDFFETIDKIEYDIILTNPPFSIKRAILKKLQEIDKPFIMIMPISVLGTKMYEPFFDQTCLGIPKSRIQFIKEGSATKNCPFDTFYYFYKIDRLEKFFKV